VGSTPAIGKPPEGKQMLLIKPRPLTKLFCPKLSKRKKIHKICVKRHTFKKTSLNSLVDKNRTKFRFM